MRIQAKPLARLHGEIKTPPFSTAARHEAGQLLWRLQLGEALSLPQSRPLPDLGPRCHELRVRDADHTWRIIYRVDPDAVLMVDVFSKKSRTLPEETITACRHRLARYDEVARAKE